jgi:fungalysin metallopeptidase (M36)/fungalysin/thermolysin propeptide
MKKAKRVRSVVRGSLRTGRVDRHPLYHVPRRIYDIESKASGRAREEIASEFVDAILPKLRVDPASLRFDTVKQSILGSHVLYQQYRDGLPVSGAWLRIDISPEGRVFHVLNDLIPEKVASKATNEKKIGARVADARARAAVKGRTRRVMSHELVQRPVKGKPRLSWKVLVRTTSPRGSWKLYVDARSGKILERIDLVKKAVGKGRVFDPNPVSSLNDPTLTPQSIIPETAYRDVDLPGLDGSGFLDGQFVSTRPTNNRTNVATNTFVFSRDNRAFREVMAYFHIDRIRRHLGDLGFNSVLNRAVEVNIDGLKDDLSQYDPPTKSILFGSGGVPDAEDGEIIVHEYGHAIQDDQVPGFGEGGEARAMGEGFGDFLSASFFADEKPPAMRPMIGTWDAAGYAHPQPCLRRVDGTKKYPKDIDNDIYDDGEIWSACLWQLRLRLGRQAAERLVIAHHHLLARNTSFADAANAMLTADQQLNGGDNAAVIRKVFADRGILRRQRKTAKEGA